MGYMEATESLNYPYLITRDTSPSRAVLEVFRFSSFDECPVTAPCLASTQAKRSRCVPSTSKIPDCVVAHRSDRCSSRVRPVPTGQTGLELLQHRLQFFSLGYVDQTRNQWFSGEPPETPRTQCSLRQSPLMTRFPRSPGSTLVLRLNQETVYDLIFLFMQSCGPHLTPLATGSLERSLPVLSTPGGLTGDDLSCLFFTCTNTSQAATCSCNT
jgi:hypothetical protein